jgi:hypothetical protein
MPTSTADVAGWQDSMTSPKKTAKSRSLGSVTPQKTTPKFKQTTCACRSPHICIPLVRQFFELGRTELGTAKERKLAQKLGGFWAVPKPIKSLDERTGNTSKKEKAEIELKIQQKTALRAAW